ncbi:hypothetical protein ATANTOWER_023140 [Ataeniobius toweri]|uniref:Uncharacterized protein n=1 Tax=Ataeniobius toweri TaxID=208326 RepID=A0ABU7A986_9TELE|nr:hypothetical protein [Ataeniobius toweri]
MCLATWATEKNRPRLSCKERVLRLFCHSHASKVTLYQAQLLPASCMHRVSSHNHLLGLIMSRIRCQKPNLLLQVSATVHQPQFGPHMDKDSSHRWLFL